MKQTILLVMPNLDEWQVWENGQDRPEACFDAREDAIEWACRVAQRLMPCAVRVHDYDTNAVQQFYFAQVAAA